MTNYSNYWYVAKGQRAQELLEFLLLSTAEGIT